MIAIVTEHPAGGQTGAYYPDAAAAILALALTLTPEAVGKLRLELHKVQLRRLCVAVTPFKGPDQQP